MKATYKDRAEVPITRELLEQFLCPICYDTIENAHRVFPCLRKFTSLLQHCNTYKKHYTYDECLLLIENLLFNTALLCYSCTITILLII
jgi:hypothetical protein